MRKQGWKISLFSYLLGIADLSTMMNLSLYPRYGTGPISIMSMVAEGMMILGIGFLPVEVGYHVYYFFITLSETIIIFGHVYSIPLALIMLVSMPLTAAIRSPADRVWSVVMSLMPTWVISVGFVYVMSTIVKTQMAEREILSRTNAELEATYARLLEHMQHADDLAVQKERVRMAREIHDTLAHTLTAAVVQMEATKKTLSVDPSRAGVELEKAQQVTREGLQELKRTIKALRPEIMENRSFVDAIRLLAEESRLAGSIDIQLQLNLDVEDGPDSLTEVSLFRVIQETITNAIRHGQATRVDVKLTQTGTRMVLEMTDNGRGILHIRKGFGLTGIQERIERLGGSVMFSSKPGSGFTTQIQIPWLKGERL